MKRGPEGERRGRRRYHPFRLIVVGVWVIGALAALVAANGPFWRDVDDWMRLAMAHAEAREWQAALLDIGHALDAAPRDPSILTFAGHLHRELSQWPEASDRFERALDADPGRPEAGLGLTEARLAIGDVPGALAALTGIDLARADADQCARAAALADQAGRPELALAILESSPYPGTVLERARLADAAGRYDYEATLLQGARNELDAPGLLMLARAFALAGRGDEARAEYAALESRGSLDSEARVHYAWLLNEEGRHREALAVLEADPAPSPETHELAARSALWADDLVRARAHARAVPGDAPELRAELAEVEARHARAAALAEAQRIRDTPPTDPAGALRFWQGKLEASPEDRAARREVVALLEADGRFDDAYEVLRSDPSPGDREATTHLARLALWTGRPGDAVSVLRDSPASGGLDREGELLLARALFESGDAAGAYRVSSGVDASNDAGALLLAARVAEATGRFDEASMRIASLSESRELTVDERLWWAGIRWRSGDVDGALEAYERLAASRPTDPGLHAAIGDLRLESGDPVGAERSYREALRLAGPGHPAGRGVALALLRQERYAEAIGAYEAYIAAAPGDVDARLALARAHAAAGDFPAAGLVYERWADGRPEDRDPAVAEEIAATWMAAGDMVRAEPWARMAAEPKGALLAQARLTHLLSLMGRHAEADDSLASLEAARAAGLSLPDPRDTSLVDAWISRLGGRPLGALHTLDPILESGDTSRVARAAWVFRAEVSEARGDLTDARESSNRATQLGAPASDVRHVTQAIDARTGLRAAAGIEAGSDERDLDVGAAWARIGLRSATGGAPALALDVRHRRASQSITDVSATAFALEADSIFPSRAFRVGARVGVEGGSDAGTRFLGTATVTYETRSALQWTAELVRQPLWAEGERSGLPDYGRVRDLALLDQTLTVTQGRVSLSTTPRSPLRPSAHLEVGAARYSDSNRRLFAYGQWRFPLQATHAGTLALTPNGFVEGFDGNQVAYASPSSFLALGMAAELDRNFGALSLDARVNPHFFRLPGESGLGLEGTAGLTLRAGAGVVRLGGRYLKQGSLYDLFRVSTEVSFPLRGSP